MYATWAALHEMLDMRLNIERNEIKDYFKDKFNVIILAGLIDCTLKSVD
jgi:hypothetical protein